MQKGQQQQARGKGEWRDGGESQRRVLDSAFWCVTWRLVLVTCSRQRVLSNALSATRSLQSVLNKKGALQNSPFSPPQRRRNPSSFPTDFEEVAMAGYWVITSDIVSNGGGGLNKKTRSAALQTALYPSSRVYWRKGGT